MLNRLILIATFALTTAFVGFGQSPFPIETHPLGTNSSANTNVQFELNFSEPITGLTASDVIVATDIPGSALVSSMTSNLGNGVNFTTTAQRARIDGFSMPTGDFTVEFRMKVTDPAGRCPFSYAVGSRDNELTYFSDGRYWARDNQINVTAPNAVVDEWTLITIRGIVAVGRVFIFHDGVPVAANGFPSSGFFGTGLSSGGVLILGEDQDSLGRGFDTGQAFLGTLDELRVWNVARSDSEIAANVETRIDPSALGLVHLYHFDEVENLGAGGDGLVDDVRDLVGTDHFDLENNLAVEVIEPASKWIADVDLAGLSGEGFVTVDVAISGNGVDVDGNALIPNPQGTTNSSFLFESCSHPTVIAQGKNDPSTELNPQRTVVFDQIVSGVTAGEFAVGGVAPGATAVDGASTVFDKAIRFDGQISGFGTPDDVLEENGLVIPGGELTIELWFQTSRGAGSTVSIAANSGGSTNFVLCRANGEIWIDGTKVMDGIDLGQLDFDWHHFAFTLDGAGVLKRYFDAIPAGERAGVTLPAPATTYLVIGNDQDSYGGGFSTADAFVGRMDEIRFWSSARSASEIAENRGQLVDPMSPSLFAYYRCDELEDLGAGYLGADDVRDFSASAFHLHAAINPVTSGPTKASEWNLDLTCGGATAFVEVDLVGTGIVNNCGLSAVSDPSGAPAFEHVFVEDLVVEATLNGSAPIFDRASAAGGDVLTLTFHSPNGSHDLLTIPQLGAQFLVAGSEPGSVGVVGPFDFSELRFDLVSAPGPSVIYDGMVSGPFAPSFMTPGGITFTSYVPLPLAGVSLSFQCLASDVFGTTANGFFAVSNTLVLDF